MARQLGTIKLKRAFEKPDVAEIDSLFLIWPCLDVQLTSMFSALHDLAGKLPGIIPLGCNHTDDVVIINLNPNCYSSLLKPSTNARLDDVVNNVPTNPRFRGNPSPNKNDVNP